MSIAKRVSLDFVCSGPSNMHRCHAFPFAECGKPAISSNVGYLDSIDHQPVEICTLSSRWMIARVTELQLLMIHLVLFCSP